MDAGASVPAGPRGSGRTTRLLTAGVGVGPAFEGAQRLQRDTDAPVR